MTDLADVIAQRCGLSFREAHHMVGQLVRTATERGVSASDISAAMVEGAASKVVARPVCFSADEIAAIIDPAQSIARRLSPGGPAPREVAAMIAQQRATLALDAGTAERKALALTAKRAVLARLLGALAAGAPVTP